MNTSERGRRRRSAVAEPITREIIKGALRAAQAEMEAVIERTAMSPFIREKKDYFAGILDARGRVVCGTMVPLFGNLAEIIFRQYPPETMRAGDLYWYNDCHGSRGGVSHSPDMVFAAPVFHRRRLVAFSQTWGHFWDIGGMRAGSISPDATEIFHEGIIVPAVRIYREGVLNDEVFRIFLRNSRFPDILQGDIRGVLAGCRLGERRVEELFQRFGAETVLDAWAFFERQCRDTIRKTLESRIPDGIYDAEDAVDGDGMSGRSFHVRMRLAKEGGSITLDTQSSDDQARGPINFIMHESVPKLIAGIYLLAAHPSVLLNDGAQDAIDSVLVRQGSILAPHWPAALGNRAHTLARVQSTVLALLALATGGDAPAANSVYNIYFLRGFDPERREFFLVSDGVAVGYGARPFADGLDAIYYVAQKNYPAEFMEMVFPVRLRQYALQRDSGGPGRFRGGCGVIREIEVLVDEAVVALRQDNILFPPSGVNGGHAGRPGRCVVNPGRADERVLSPMSDGNVVRKGDVMRLETSGGGGWGDPLDRPIASVRLDVLGGFVSVESAREDYGVVIDERGVTDAAATARLRALKQGPVRMFHRNGYYGPLVSRFEDRLAP
ncbi:MAG TPA: hydantoinase B/oxoprolinase family protein [Candidatus Methylomirabilis sp.]|nr:hydantoinase B/oxoprolinase family protein [Candidatus Methylomirabilis sp.]